MGQKVCGLPCAIAFGHAQNQEKARKAQKKRDKAKKEELKSRRDLANAAQVEFNKWVRERDRHKPCVSCGRFHQGQYHAGHYRSRAAAPQLRFNVFNTHKQCQPCNTHLSGNLALYREELLRRIGEDRVLAIEHNSEPANFTREYLIRLRSVFRRRTKHLRRIRSLPRPENF